MAQTEATYVRLARERQERDLGRQGEDGFPYRFDEEAGQRVVDFFPKYLRHFKGEHAGEPFILEEWEEFIVRTVFGWKHVETGLRRFRRALIEVAKQNGKSSFAAGLALYMTTADGEAGAQCFSAATKRDQAKIVHGYAVEMLKRSPGLKRFLKTRVNNIYCPDLGSRFEPVGADYDTLDGLSPHLIVADELHAHKSRGVIDALETGMASRSQPLMLMTTTAGVFDPTKVGWIEHDSAVKVLEGATRDETLFAFIASADEDDEWADPETWAKANPNLGVSVQEDYLEAAVRRAEREPSYLNTYLRYHLNIWTEQLDRWIPMDRWDDCGGGVDEGTLEGRPCWGGLDLATVTDLAALVLAFDSDEEDHLDLLCRFWCPEDAITERSKRDRVPYDAWARDGWITPTPGNVIDHNRIREDILELSERHRIQQIAFDPHEATGLSIQLAEEHGLPMIRFPQGTRNMNEPCRTFERLLMSGKLHHGDNPVLRWMASNVALYEDSGGRVRPDKKRSSEKIDGIVAAIIAVGRAAAGPAPEESVYENRGVLVLG